MIKAAIFDYGGVIKGPFSLSMVVAELYNIPSEELKKMSYLTLPLFSLFYKGLINEDDFWREVSIIFKKPVPQNCRNLSREIYGKSLFLFPKMVELIKKLKNNGIKLAILSNITEFQAKTIRENDGYEGFDIVVLSYEEKQEKPDPDIYLATIKKLEVKPEECIFIDDKEENLLPAINLGMKTVLAENTDQIIKDVSLIIKENEKYD